MANQQARILVVENDPIVGDLIARQALGDQGYDIEVVNEANAAIRQAMSFSPDVVIANLELPGLSGKDLMVALASQNIHIPVIIIASQGQEKDIIQAFRLGASDYISAPIREAEVVSAVERALKTVRARKEREELSSQLQRTNQELEKRVNELITIFSLGKAVLSITDQKTLYDEIIKGAVNITQADYGWLLIRDERSNEFILRAQLNLPKSLLANMGKPWDDGISSLVAQSGESFSIFGDSFERFPLSSMGKSALVVPVKVIKQILALLVVMRKSAQEFGASDQAMLEAIGDYLAISLVNARLFRALSDES
jgi:DNA-binding response OmpR family regulator